MNQALAVPSLAPSSRRRQACAVRPPRLLALAAALAAAAQAQTPPAAAASAPADAAQQVVIRGQAANLRGALDAQQAAQGIVSVVHADGIGQLPDGNAAEALQRVPGVSIERDQGEGRFVRIRGLGPDLNSVTINGTLVPAAEADRRAVGLDVVPAALIRSLEVSKTWTPDQDAGALGGSVAVNTLSGFDHAGRFTSLDLGFLHDGNTGRLGPSIAGVWSDRLLDGKLGIALALSHDQRKFGSDNVETGDAWDFSGSQPVLGSFERRDYRITRERSGGALNLDWRPDDQQRYYLRTFSSRFTDQEQRQSQKIEFDEAQAAGASGGATVTRALKDRREISQIDSLALGGERQLGDWKAWAALGLGRASENKPDTLSSGAFKGSFSGVGYSGSEQPLLQGPAALADAAGYTLDKIKLERSRADDRERNLSLDLERAFDVAGRTLAMKGGLKFSRRDKRNEVEAFSYSAKALKKAGLSSSQLAMANFLSGSAVDYAWGSFGPALSASAIRSLVAGLDASAYRDDEASAVNDFSLREERSAGYLQATLDLAASTQLVGGLRYESGDFAARGYSWIDDTLGRVSVDSSSRDWLPALLLRHELDRDTALRASVTKSVVRPSFGQLAPGFVSDGSEAEFGNPALRSLHSANLDLGVERRLARDAAVSAYVFHKSIRDFVYQTDLAGSGQWAGYDSVLSYANGDRASVSGVELAYNQALRMLPAPWNGLIVGANATLVKSSATIAGSRAADGSRATREIPLPSQSDRSVNLSLGYETPLFSARLALNHKSPYLLEVGNVLDARHDHYVDTQNQVDFSLRINLSRSLQLSLEALNLGNEKYYVYAGSKPYNVQYERYGRSLKVGLRLIDF